MNTKRHVYIERPDGQVKVVFTVHAMERLFERSIYRNLQALALQIGEPRNWANSHPDDERGGNHGDGAKLIVTLGDGSQIALKHKVEDVETFIVMSAY